jgi:uncharacterized protein
MKVAVVGSGIAGLFVAHRLHRSHDVTVFEANDYAGGHTHTVDVEQDGRQYAIDTGFIVFNDWTYPNFIALLRELGVESQPSNMSFSLRCERTGLEYNGSSLNGLFAQRRNLVRPRFLRMLVQILRFNRCAPALLAQDGVSPTLWQYLEHERYGAEFIEHYIVPMGKSIWSSTESAVLAFPARFFIEFFERHGFLSVNERPLWRAVRGGSREYVKQLTAPLRGRLRLRLRTPVSGIERDADGVRLRTMRGELTRFDYVFLACHADQALALLARPTPQEQAALSCFGYQHNDVALHTDLRLLPHAPRARAAWNYHALARAQAPVALTYDMNLLQNLTAPQRFLVTLNRTAEIEPRRLIRTLSYAHPVYSPAAVAAQRRRSEVSGVNRTFYCGAYWRYGFHEDGIVSAQWALEEFELSLAQERRGRPQHAALARSLRGAP